MRGSKLVEAMAVAVDRVVSTREGTSALDCTIEAIFDVISRFNGNDKDATSYLEAYWAKMMMRDITEDKRLTSFPRVVMLSIHAEVLEVQADSSKSTVSRCYARVCKRAGPRGSWTKEKGKRNRARKGSFAQEEVE